MSTRSILKQLLDSFFLKLHFMYSFSIVVIENLYIQTSLMVALSLFRVREGGGGPIYKSEVDITSHEIPSLYICCSKGSFPWSINFCKATPFPSHTGNRSRVWVQAKIHGIARKVSIPPGWSPMKTYEIHTFLGSNPWDPHILQNRKDKSYSHHFRMKHVK